MKKQIATVVSFVVLLIMISTSIVFGAGESLVISTYPPSLLAVGGNQTVAVMTEGKSGDNGDADFYDQCGDFLTFDWERNDGIVVITNIERGPTGQGYGVQFNYEFLKDGTMYMNCPVSTVHAGGVDLGKIGTKSVKIFVYSVNNWVFLPGVAN